MVIIVPTIYMALNLAKHSKNYVKVIQNVHFVDMPYGTWVE